MGDAYQAGEALRDYLLKQPPLHADIGAFCVGAAY